MALAHLLSLRDPNDFAARSEWTFWHANHHAQINTRLSQMGTFMPTYILDPLADEDFLAWINRHADLHSKINAKLGFNGQDLTGLDIGRTQSVSDWVELNFSEHQNWERRIGLPL